MYQKEIFKSSEADNWFRRNRALYDADSIKDNILLDLLNKLQLSPKIILEIGCSNGFRLNEIRKEFSCDCYGIDPSSEAINDGRTKYPYLALSVATADDLRFDDGKFDTIIFGFCLYLCDRNDLFKIAYEADRCLKNQGYIIITDFLPPFPYKNKYSHHPNVYSYKMNYSNMFIWNPVYTEIAQLTYTHSGPIRRDIPDERIATVILRKNAQFAYPNGPYTDNAYE